MIEVQEGPGLSHAGDPIKGGFVADMVAQAADVGTRAASLAANGASLAGVHEGTLFTKLI